MKNFSWQAQWQKNANLEALVFSLAFSLFDESGHLKREKVNEASRWIEKHLFSLHLDGAQRAFANENILRKLQLLSTNEALFEAIEKIPVPHKNPLAEEVFRKTAGLKNNEDVTVQQARAAALSAWLFPLRQRVGSCFATAVALQLQEEAPVSFFSDIKELAATGKLERVVEGRLFSVPMNLFFEKEAEKGENNNLLRSWEYTLASLSESKGAFSTWNLFTSLGLDHETSGGIGEVVWKTVQALIERSNELVEDYQQQMRYLYEDLSLAEGRLKAATSEESLKWIRADYQMKKARFYSEQDHRDKEVERRERLAQSYALLSEVWLQYFPEYFQEVYDPDMVELDSDLYDDAPAGFRLLYKHGRSNPSAWTLIYNENEFISSLVSFFNSVEVLLLKDEVFLGLTKELSEIVTAVIQHVRSEFFIKTAYERMAKRHGLTTTNTTERASIKPWAYRSGGTIQGLLTVYLKQEEPFIEITRSVESAQELLLFLEEVVERLSNNKNFYNLKEKNKSLLMHSPTHAFRFLPGFEPFCNGWQANELAYIWMRDAWYEPNRRRVTEPVLSEAETLFLLETIKQSLSKDTGFNFQKNEASGAFRYEELRNWVIKNFPNDHQKNYLTAHVDSLFYQHLPMVSWNAAQEIEERFDQEMSGLSIKKTQQLSRREFYTKQQFIEALFLTYSSQEVFNLSFDPYKKVLECMRGCGVSCLEPLIFADNNWSKTPYFAFVVSPGSLEIELWRLDPTGLQGAPMAEWRCWLDGSRVKPPWGVIT